MCVEEWLLHRFAANYSGSSASLGKAFPRRLAAVNETMMTSALEYYTPEDFYSPSMRVLIFHPPAAPQGSSGGGKRA